jgi:CHRD domain
MEKRFLALTAVGLAAAIAVPTIAFGNARNNDPGSLADLHAAQTPLVALMAGPNELTTSGNITPTGDADGSGAAAFTFDIIDPLSLVAGSAQVCWDITYSNLTGTPSAAHIHRGAAGVGGPVVIVAPSLPNLTATGTTSCIETTGVLATEIKTTPANFYINIHTTDFPSGAIRGQLSTGPEAAGEAHLLPTPLRAYDSRANAGAKILPGETRTINLTTGATLAAPTVKVLAVPPGATAAIITLTIADTDAPGGFLTIYSAASTQPATSSINWKAAGQDIAVGTQVAVDATGSVKITDGVGTAPTHFIIDVVGYMY